MFLYLLRHGEAHPHARNDSLRSLTDKGRADVRKVAALFLDRGITLDRCLASPYVRARETATAFLTLSQPGLQPEFNSMLTPEHRAREVLSLLDTIPGTHVMLVSHNPLVSEMYAMLTGCDIDERHILGTSELVAIDLPLTGIGQGQVIFTLQP